jgi:hypothetical protein
MGLILSSLRPIIESADTAAAPDAAIAHGGKAAQRANL